MSSELLNEINQNAIQAGVDVCWHQWAALGAPVATDRSHRVARGSIIDPEALVLHTLAMADHERRLRDLVAWWARVGSRHLSVVRMETLAERFPEEARVGVGHFAFLAHEAGDRSWKRRSNRPSWHGAVRDKGGESPTLRNPPALMLRLRAGFGVGIKSDLLAVLIGFGGRRIPVRTLVQATGYTEPPLRDAIRDMARAGFLRRTDERPARHYVDPDPWGPVLFGSNTSLSGESGQRLELPRWHFWPDVFSLLRATVSEARRLRDEQVTDYVAASSLRDLFDAHRQAFERNEIPVADVSGPLGERFVEVFRTTIRGLVDWIDEAIRGSAAVQ